MDDPLPQFQWRLWPFTVSSREGSPWCISNYTADAWKTSMATIKEIKNSFATIKELKLFFRQRKDKSFWVENNSVAIQEAGGWGYSLGIHAFYERNFISKLTLIAGVGGLAVITNWDLRSRCSCFTKNCKIKGLNDSRRSQETSGDFQAVQNQTLSISIGIMDNLGHRPSQYLWSNQAGSMQKKSQLRKFWLTKAPFLIVPWNWLPISQTSMSKENANSLSIAAASIVWVTRDGELWSSSSLAVVFATNAGCGTNKHLEGLEKLGVTQFTEQVLNHLNHWF